MKTACFYYLFLVGFLFHTICQGMISDHEFRTIYQISERIKVLCPPSTCVVIGVGRSPTAIMAYLHYAWNLPLTNFRYGVRASNLDQNELRKLFEHFSIFVPSMEKLNNRSVMLLDFASINGGESIVAASRYIKAYFNEVYGSAKIIKPNILIAVIKENRNLEVVPFLFKYIFLLKSDNSLLKKLASQGFDNLSEFGKFDIKNDEIKSPSSSEIYLQLFQFG
jgi:hypothetical protein